jgi:hypothetical protein
MFPLRLERTSLKCMIVVYVAWNNGQCRILQVTFGSRDHDRVGKGNRVDSFQVVCNSFRYRTDSSYSHRGSNRQGIRKEREQSGTS